MLCVFVCEHVGGGVIVCSVCFCACMGVCGLCACMCLCWGGCVSVCACEVYVYVHVCGVKYICVVFVTVCWTGVVGGGVVCV